jgi:hypothetical protein
MSPSSFGIGIAVEPYDETDDLVVSTIPTPSRKLFNGLYEVEAGEISVQVSNTVGTKDARGFVRSVILVYDPSIPVHEVWALAHVVFKKDQVVGVDP